MLVYGISKRCAGHEGRILSKPTLILGKDGNFSRGKTTQLELKKLKSF